MMRKSASESTAATLRRALEISLGVPCPARSTRQEKKLSTRHIEAMGARTHRTQPSQRMRRRTRPSQQRDPSRAAARSFEVPARIELCVRADSHGACEAVQAQKHKRNETTRNYRRTHPSIHKQTHNTHIANNGRTCENDE